MAISFAAIFVRLALPAPPVVTGFYRMLFASLAIGAWLAVRGRPLRVPLPAGAAAVGAGLAFGADHAFWNTALVETSVAMATLLVNLTPVHVGLYALLVRREVLDRSFVGGAALALGGCALLLGFSWHDLQHLRGGLLALVASLFYAGYLLLMSRARREIDAVPALLLATLSAAVVLAAGAGLRGDAFAGFPARSWAAMLGAAGVAQIGGVLGIVWALRHLPTTFASVALLVQPVGSALWAWWLFGEGLGALQLLGGATVLAGILLASRFARGS